MNVRHKSLFFALSLSCASIQPAAAIDGLVTHRTGDPLVDRLLIGNKPLTSEQSLKLRGYLEDDAQKLERKTPAGVTQGEPMTVIDLTQGAPAKQVVLQQGYNAMLMVVGENGAPWPIERASAGDDGVIKPVVLESRNTAVELTPVTPWAKTNIFIYLAGRSEPIKIYARVSADPSQGLNDTIKIVVDGVPAGSAPLLQANRVAVDDQLMNAIGQGPGRNWIALTANNDGRLPFRINYWMSPDRKSSIVRLRNAQLVGPDWDAETRDPDGVARVYRYERVPLMLRVRDSDGIEHQVRVDNPADLLAGRDASKSLTVKNITPERPPLTKPLEWEAPIGLVGTDRTQTIMRSSLPADDVSPSYMAFDGQGKRGNRVEIISEPGQNRDMAKRLIEDAYQKRPAPLTPSKTIAGSGQQAAVPSANDVQVSAAPVSSSPAISGTITQSVPEKGTVSASSSIAAGSVPVVATPPSIAGGYSMKVSAGGLYENLYRFTESVHWKAPIWDLGKDDYLINGDRTITGDSAADVILKYLTPYATAYNFKVRISSSEKAVWLY